MVRRRALHRGVLGGDRRWMSVWVVLAGLQLVRRIASAREVVERFELKPGDIIVIRDLGMSEAELEV
jgi:hypothetical protein